MKVFLLGIAFVSCIVYTHERKPIGKLTNLGSVTRFEGIEKYYQALQQQKSDTPPQESKQPEKNANIKKILCKNIFSSDFFDMQEEDWIDIDTKDNRMDLKNEHPKIFRSMYREYRILCLVLPFSGDSCYSYRYENDYKLYPVSVGSLKRDEYLFTCLVRDRRSRKIKPYFVSEEYDVNVLDTYPMAGRFIFTYNNSRSDDSPNNELTLHAMAEESAVGWDFLGRFIEMYYVSERSADRTGLNSRRNSSTITAVEKNNNNKSSNVANRVTDSKRSGNANAEKTSRTTTDGGRTADGTRKSHINNEKKANDLNSNSLDKTKNETDASNKASSTLSWPGAVRSVSNSTVRAMPNENTDPICLLTADEKLRLCASIFASSVFKGKVKFLPTVDNVQLNCEKKQISFNADVSNPPPFMARITQWEIRESGKKIYEESVIGCRGLLKSRNYKMMYLVSRGNYDNSVFVYTHKYSDRRVFVYNYFNNTSVI